MQKATPKSNRSRLISLIHLQKKEAALEEGVYRIIIFSATGKESCGECSLSELKAVFTDLNSVLEKQGKKPFSFYYRRELPELKDAVRARARKILGDDWQNRIDSFAQAKFSKAKYMLCSKSELRRIMAFLTNMERRCK